MKKLALFSAFLLTLLAPPSQAVQINGQLEKAGLERLSADPSGTFEGRIYANTTSHACVYYNGSAWKALAISGAIANVDIVAGAAIAYSKLALTGAILNADLAGSIASSKLVGSDIATVGTISSGTWNGTKVSEAYGGTNQSTYALGDLLYSSATNTLSKLSGNTTTTQKFLAQTGTGSVSAAPGWVALASTDIPSLDTSKLTTGTLAVARGGTGTTTSTGSGNTVLSTSPALTTPTIAGSTLSGAHSVTGSLGYLQTAASGGITSAGTYNDVAITGVYAKFTGITGNLTITGFDNSAAVDGRVLYVQLVSADNSSGRVITIAHNNSSSSANNRIFTSTKADQTCTMTASASNFYGCMLSLIYDTANGKWDLLAHNP